MAASVEVEEGSEAGSLGHIALGLGVSDALESAVKTVDVGLVVLGVVKLHDLAGDVRLECAVVVCAEKGTMSVKCLVRSFVRGKVLVGITYRKGQAA